MLNDLEILLIGVAVMMLMAVAVITFVLLYQRKVLTFKDEKLKDEQQKQREIAMASIQSEEQERKRIAAELHDDIGANLSAVNLLLSSYLKNEKDVMQIEEAKGLLNSSLQTIRGLAYKIHPSPLQKLGLQPAVESYLNIVNKGGTVKITFPQEQKLPRFDESVELNAYRIIQEFVTNILKYANAHHLYCNLKFDADVLLIKMKHDGEGMVQQEFEDALKSPKGLGLQNIKHRLEIQNGSYVLYKESNLFYIELQIPTMQKKHE